MNSRRLSIKDRRSKIEDNDLIQLLNRLLSGPSNLEYREDGKIFIKSLNKFYSPRDSLTVHLQDENGLVLREFESLVEAARYFEVDPSTVRY